MGQKKAVYNIIIILRVCTPFSELKRITAKNFFSRKILLFR